MSIRTCLNELFKYNKVAEKAKKLTATALVAGTILTGAGLTACEKTPGQSETTTETTENVVLENPYEKIQEKLQNIKSDFDLDYITFVQKTVEDKTNSLMYCYDYKEETDEIKYNVSYEISNEEMQKIIDYIQQYSWDTRFVIIKADYADSKSKELLIHINEEALKDNTYNSLASTIYNMIRKPLKIKDYTEQKESEQIESEQER